MAAILDAILDCPWIEYDDNFISYEWVDTILYYWCKIISFLIFFWNYRWWFVVNMLNLVNFDLLTLTMTLTLTSNEGQSTLYFKNLLTATTSTTNLTCTRCINILQIHFNICTRTVKKRRPSWTPSWISRPAPKI